MDATKEQQLTLRIGELIKERGWSITELMRRSGLSYPTALRLAHGKVDRIELATLAKLCEVFDLPVGDLFATA